MKKEFRFFLIALFTIAITTSAYFFNGLETEQQRTPRPTRINYLKEGENEELKHKKREEWIEEMHNAAPDVKWREIDQETRYTRSKILSQKSFKNDALEGYWKEVGSNNQAGRILLSEIDTSTGYLYCASSGGNVWKTSLDNPNWTVLNNQLRIPSIHFLRIIHQENSKRILLATGQWQVEGFYYSDDDGENWNVTTGLSAIVDWGYIKRAVVTNDENHTIYLLAQEWDYTDWEVQTTIYISTNLGESFSVLKTFKNSTHGSPSNFDLWCNKYGSSTVYLAQNDTLQKFDQDHNIITISSDLPFNTSGNYYLSGCEKDGTTHLYLMSNSNGQGDIYRSSDDGINWEHRGNVTDNPFMRNSFECSAKNPDVLYFGGVECYKSYTGASSWSKINGWGDYYGNPDIYLHADICGINSFLKEDGDETLVISTDGGIYISNDSLETVQNISLENLNVSQYYSTYTCRFNTDITHAGSQDQGYQMAIIDAANGTVDVEQVISGDYGHIVSGDEGASIWMVYPGFAAYYPDINNSQGSSWWDFESSDHHWMPPLMIDPEYPNIVYLGGGSTTDGAHIFALTYNAGSVSSVEMDFDFSGSNDSKIAAIAHSPIDNSYWYLTTSNGEFYLSNDGGLSWTQTPGVTGPGANYLYGSAILPSTTQLGKLYIAGSGYSNSPAYVSTDHGQNFTAINSGLPNTMIYEIAQHPNEKLIFAATDVGPYVYFVDDDQWYSLMDTDSPDQVYWTVDFIPDLNTARFGTYGRGIWDFVVTDNVSINPIENNDSGILVYPNPGNGDFIIEFATSINEKINIKIFNSAGQLITENDYVASSDFFRQEFQLSNQPAGIYYIRINDKVSKKIIIQ